MHSVYRSKRLTQNQVLGRIQLFIVNEYAAQYAVARHYLVFVDVVVFAADSV